MEPSCPSAAVPPRPGRRRFLELVGGAIGLSTAAACGPRASVGSAPRPRAAAAGTRPHSNESFDPWIEIDGSAYRHNVQEAAKRAGGRPILAVVKNNAYGLGDRVVGPLLADMPEVGGIACVRVDEAVALRDAGVTKPIMVMAETSEAEMEELARMDCAPSIWLDDAPRRVGRVAGRLGRPVSLHMFLDTGMGREGMPWHRARSWMEDVCSSEAVDVAGTYTMFAHDMDFDLEQQARFEELLTWGRSRSLALGTIHAAPSFELFHLPSAHYDMVRPGNALFGNYPSLEGVQDQTELKPVFRLRARVVRVERLEAGETAGFYRTYAPDRPTWVALLPVGRTDGYPSEANGTCEVLIGGRLYPVMGGVNSAHAIIDVGEERRVEVGDVATLIGPDHPAVLPHTVAERCGIGFVRLLQGMNPRLPRLVV